jgi:flagellar assembly protein FliH
MSERFLFDQEFDAHGRAKPRARAEIFDQDDLSAARAQAYAEGEQAGQATAASGIDANAAQVLDQITQGITETAAAFNDFAEGWRQEAASIAITVGQKLAQRLLAEQPLAEIEAMVIDCVGQLQEEPRLVVRTSSPVAEAIADRINDITARTGFGGHLVILPDETMTDQDCRIEWAHGGVERSVQETDAAITRAVNDFMAARPGPRNQDHV